ncbi:MAG: imidazole glycerol phosphate synthase subunit HisF [Clostridiaceae bacterium]|nr:imidazole glycerol phosphate synthase subunit HisF [Clostridiaceae bacterium]
MLPKRIISCLDIKDGRVVKGVNFVDIRDAADPVEAAMRYEAAGVDELVFLDISATLEKRKTMIDLVKQVASQITIPLTVGGGIRSVEDIRAVLQAGANKVSLNSVAVENPDIISEAVKLFGSSAIVVAIDAKTTGHLKKEVVIAGGTIETGLDPVAWAIEAEKRGAGAILYTSMDKDGTKEGYDLDLTSRISEAVNIPVIASGGAGDMRDFYEAFTIGKADAALAASLFHFGEVKIPELKHYLAGKGIPIHQSNKYQNEDDPEAEALARGRRPFAGKILPAQGERIWNKLKLNSEGLMPAITIERNQGDVLMLAYMNKESFLMTLKTGLMHYYSRSRDTLWMKGEQSGHIQTVTEARLDCDMDILLFTVEQTGPACHTGNRTCFYMNLEDIK